MKNKDINAEAPSALTPTTSAHNTEELRATQKTPSRSTYHEFETPNGKIVTRLTGCGRDIAKQELLRLLETVGPARTSELRGTNRFHGEHTLSEATVRKLLRELEEAGEVTSRLRGHGMRTCLVWTRK
ncbi:MAG: hypothetical protein QOI07_3238 [Verrucomicrobiota bacterium]|jgi:hypothetical protein